jgi:Papain family cysteine protease
LEYIKRNGIASGIDYYYTFKNDTCMRFAYPRIFDRKFNVCTYELNGDEEKLRILVQNGPVAGCIATTDSFTSYSGGYFYDHTCPDRLDHAIVSLTFYFHKYFNFFSLQDNCWLWHRCYIRRLLVDS